jgi:hypothetical protein
MKKIVLAALAATSALIAVPAAAQNASGTVNVSGTVAPKCTAITPIAGNIVLNELALANGTVDTAFTANTNLSLSFTVRCTGANPELSADANPLVNTAIVTPASGYTNTVHYNATLTALRAGGGSGSIVDSTTNAAATTGNVGDRLANLANNVTIAVSSGSTSTATDLLEAGTYGGTIDIIVGPPV